MLLALLIAALIPLTSQQDDQPLPDIPTLMHEVEVHQRQSEAIEKNYIFREDSTITALKSDGSLKKTETGAAEVFWLHGVQVHRTLRKDNRDLTPDELKKEDDRIDKEVKKAQERRAKEDSEGKETDSHGHEEITLSRILELGSFSNPRRILLNGRPTIVVDYTGNPSAKTHNPGEAALKVLAGAVFVDEQDKAIQHIEGHFIDNFKVGAGFVVNIHKDTSFTFANARINDEVWLFSSLEAHGFARYLLFFSLDGSIHVRASQYRKFKATSTLLPNTTPAADLPPEAPPTPPQ